MTLHRWRKHYRSDDVVDLPQSSNVEIHTSLAPKTDGNQIEHLKLENGRLRRIVSDLLLEKMKIQKALDDSKK